MKRHGNIGCLLLMVCGIMMCSLTACTSRAVQEAERVVAQADSTWQAGLPYADSTQLAQAYETLKKHSEVSRQLSEISPFVPCTSSLCTYAHACYHYGRLLREKDNPVGAMECFINATHSRTRDYHILGRVYSNMGDICHLASDFRLSYDMFERSADCFLESGDTMSYYYDVNRMAFEKADLADSAACLLLIQKLKDIPNIYELTSITKAELFTKIQLYDSAIYYANILIDSALYTPTCALIKANAFSYLGQNDSALAYANIVIADTLASYQNKFNALYFISHLDSALSVEEIQSLASLREDIRYYEYEPDKEKLTQAVQLLEQDLNRKPDWRWLYTLIAVVLFLFSSLVFIHVWRKRKLHQHITREIDIKQHQREQLSEGLAAMHSEIAQLSDQQQKTHQQLMSDIEATCNTLRSSKELYIEPYWKDYGLLCETINQRFNNIIVLLQKCSLSEREVRLCILVLIGGFSDKQMADTLYYSYKTIRSTKRHIALKLGTTSANLRTFLIEKIIE